MDATTARNPGRRSELSPNQRHKRQQIVNAARAVLADKGIAACTEREVAAASPLTKSAVHYYFADMNDLIDQAMAGHVDAFVADLRAAATNAAPGQTLWAVVDAYLATFRAQPRAALLWFEFWIHSSRTERLAAVATIEDSVINLLAEALGDLGRPPPQSRPTVARAVYALLGGTIVEQSTRPAHPAEVRARIEALISPDAPRAPIPTPGA
ncbi:MAG: TetR/AcrR family transcriptional regulator [Frankia sp.]